MEDRGQAALIENDRQNRKTAERLVWASLVLILLLSVFGHEKAAIAVAVTTVAAVITGFLSKKPSGGKEPSESSSEE
jgi:cobalamin synthase